MIGVVAGGVGAARFLEGLAAVVPPAEVTAIVNTGDDFRLHGLAISPDLDTIVYTLAGAADRQRGWGLRGETWAAMDELETLGGEAWFRLGDRDLATHLFRTQRLDDGASLTEVTAELARARGVAVRVLPMSDDRVATILDVEGEGEVSFQHYFVRRGHAVAVRGVRFDGAAQARPAPGVLEAIAEAERLVIAPSNPIVSIDPILSVPGVRAAVGARRADAVAVSPIVAGRALKGPADRLLVELGHEATVVGIARLYAPLAGTLVVDEVDAAHAAAVEAEGVRCVVAPTVMVDPAAAAALAKVVLRA